MCDDGQCGAGEPYTQSQLGEPCPSEQTQLAKQERPRCSRLSSAKLPFFSTGTQDSLWFDSMTPPLLWLPVTPGCLALGSHGRAFARVEQGKLGTREFPAWIHHGAN